MIKLKNEINKSATMRELRKEAEKMYENSWEREYAIEKFMEGAESLFNLLRLPIVSNNEERVAVCPKCGTKLGKTRDGRYCLNLKCRYIDFG